MSVTVPSSESSPRIAPERRLLLQPALFGRLNAYSINPVGVEAHLLAAFQQRLYADERAALRDNFVLVGLKPQLNPAQIILGTVVELQPASFFNLKLSAEHWTFFGTFGALQSFGAPSDDFSGPSLRDHWTAAQNYGTQGWHFAIAPTLQGAWKGFALRLRPSFDFYALGLRTGDRYWYNGRNDLLVGGRGWTAAGDADILYTGFTGWTLGATYSISVPLYEGVDARWRTANAFQRLGPVVAYTFFDRGFSTFDRPTLFLLTQWFIQHRWATPGPTRAIPYVVVGVIATSDFL